jgi:hypothetical protein
MKIAVGNSRMDKKWKNKDISWEDFCARVKTTQRTTETVEEYRKLKRGQQDDIKDVVFLFHTSHKELLISPSIPPICSISSMT